MSGPTYITNQRDDSNACRLLIRVMDPVADHRPLHDLRMSISKTLAYPIVSSRVDISSSYRKHQSQTLYSPTRPQYRPIRASQKGLEQSNERSHPSGRRPAVTIHWIGTNSAPSTGAVWLVSDYRSKTCARGGWAGLVQTALPRRLIDLGRFRLCD